MATTEKRAKKEAYSEAEIDVLVSEEKSHIISLVATVLGRPTKVL